MENRKTERSSHKEYKATKRTVAIFLLAAAGASFLPDLLSSSDNTEESKKARPNPPSNLTITVK